MSAKWPGLTAFLVLGAAWLLPACTPVARDFEQVSERDRIVIRFSHSQSEATPLGRAAQKFATQMRAVSLGRVEVQVFPNSTLYSEVDEVPSLRSGDLQMIAPTTTVLSGVVPSWQVLELPFAFSTVEAARAVMAKQVGERLRRDVSALGMTSLALWEDGFKDVASSTGALLRPGDFRNQVFGVQPSAISRQIWGGMGAQIRTAPFGEVYRLLEKKQISAVESTAAVTWWQQFHQFQRHITVSRHSLSAHVVLVNSSFWESLPPRWREALREAMADTTQWLREQAPQLQAEAMTKLQLTPDVSVRILSPADIRAWQGRLAPVWDQVAGDVGRDLVQAVRPGGWTPANP